MSLKICLSIAFLLAACASRGGSVESMTPAEQAALAKLEVESAGDFSKLEKQAARGAGPSKSAPAPTAQGATLPASGGMKIESSASCYLFKFFNQKRRLLNEAPLTVCKGDGPVIVQLKSPQGRVAALRITGNAVFDPHASITFLGERKLLCYDGQRNNNAVVQRRDGSRVVNCCSDVYFHRYDQKSVGRVVSGRLDGPPANCAQD